MEQSKQQASDAKGDQKKKKIVQKEAVGMSESKMERKENKKLKERNGK